jgi:hypothetical protein
MEGIGVDKSATIKKIVNEGFFKIEGDKQSIHHYDICNRSLI